MANEISVNLSLSVNNGNLKTTRQASASYDQTGTRVYSNVQAVGTTHEEIVVSADITTYSYAWIRNLDDTNFVTIGLLDSDTSFKPFSVLDAGQFAVIPLTSSSVEYYAKADTASVDLEIIVVEA